MKRFLNRSQNLLCSALLLTLYQPVSTVQALDIIDPVHEGMTVHSS